jgi:hypothetical protein
VAILLSYDYQLGIWKKEKASLCDSGQKTMRRMRKKMKKKRKNVEIVIE